MRRLAGTLIVMSGWVLLYAPPALATISLKQTGNEASVTGSSITPGLFSGTTSGDLLIAVIVDTGANCANDNISGPAGWVKAASTCKGNSTNGPLQVWYDANVSAGVTSATFSGATASSTLRAELTEWSGVATSSPADQTGSASPTAASATPSVTTSGNISVSGELAFIAFMTNTGETGLSAGTGATLIGNDTTNGLIEEYSGGPTAGSPLTASVNANPSTNYGGVVVTFEPPPTCSGGSLQFTGSSTEGFPSVTLNGFNKSSTSSLALTVTDDTGSGSGWSLYGTSTTLTTGGSSTLPTNSTTITSGSASAATGNCSLPTDLISYPVTLPAGPSSPTAVELYDAHAGTGSGASTVTLGTSVTVPGGARTGMYGSIWTLTLASGP